MSQVVNPNGQAMGQPGGSKAVVYCFADYGDPNSRADPKGLLAGCALGSTWQRIDGPDATHFLYVKTGAATQANATGVWTNK